MMLGEVSDTRIAESLNEQSGKGVPRQLRHHPHLHFTNGLPRYCLEGALLRYSAWGRRYPFPGYLQRMRTVSGVPSDVKRFMSAMRI
ncbi:hypothetical protein HOY34_13010 [Xinfangfangia sp. D13-10-4-6]|uniref:hypothetical protein n=1 Tax=Pseudogemmobacter hezensis TaxID=2737662 RepID=UPI001551C9A3|nr:hypothetical protein [Pseudogemmobacter hezensis]NPD16118.1 hypothetical protein [Pseudogemmobacter hezensis]